MQAFYQSQPALLFATIFLCLLPCSVPASSPSASVKACCSKCCDAEVASIPPPHQCLLSELREGANVGSVVRKANPNAFVESPKERCLLGFSGGVEAEAFLHGNCLSRSVQTKVRFPHVACRLMLRGGVDTKVTAHKEGSSAMSDDQDEDEDDQDDEDDKDDEDESGSAEDTSSESEAVSTSDDCYIHPSKDPNHIGPLPPSWPGPYEHEWGQGDPNLPNRYDSAISTNGILLVDLADAGNLDGVVSLLSAGVDPNYHDDGREGATALHMATVEGHQQVVEVLLDAGAKVDETDRLSGTALHLAAGRGYFR